MRYCLRFTPACLLPTARGEKSCRLIQEIPFLLKPFVFLIQPLYFASQLPNLLSLAHCVFGGSLCNVEVAVLCRLHPPVQRSNHEKSIFFESEQLILLYHLLQICQVQQAAPALSEKVVLIIILLMQSVAKRSSLTMQRMMNADSLTAKSPAAQTAQQSRVCRKSLATFPTGTSALRALIAGYADNSHTCADRSVFCPG